MEWFKDFCGIKMSSNYQTFDLLSRVLKENDGPLKRIIEIGTFTGSLSIYLGLEANRRNIPMLTIDIQNQITLMTERLFKTLNINFWELDVFRERERLFELFHEPIFLLCDGGNKADEFAMCVPRLATGSIVAVYDYSVEFLDRHWQNLQHYAEPIMQNEWMKENAQMALFRIK